MENVLRIIYDKSINNKILNLNDIEKILELLVIDKNLNEYILNIDVQLIKSNNLASYSTYDKKITIFSLTIKKMLQNIEKNVLILNNFEHQLYKNLSILQVLLHEVEHANQIKISYNDNTLETFIIRISNLVNEKEDLYEFCPTERFAEIKSFEELLFLLNYITKRLDILPKVLETEKSQRLLKGYHYYNWLTINSPLITYFISGRKKHLLESFSWFSNNLDDSLIQVCDEYELNERLKYGFPITIDEYSSSMEHLILSLNKNFKNRINAKLK